MYDPSKQPHGAGLPVQQTGYAQPGYHAQQGYQPPPLYTPQPAYAPTHDLAPPYGSDGGLVGTGFSSKDIRMAFVRKVYTILFIQLAVTTAFIGVFIYTKEVNLWVLANPGATLGAYITFIILYLVLICCEHVRRQHPTNVVLLGIFTCALSYMVGVISCTYKTESVLLAFGICAVCCLAVTLFSFNTKYDFTSCAGILFVAAIAFMIFGFIMIFFRTEVMHKVYAGVGALLFMLFLAFDTQMIMGGKKLEISPEEYVFASIQLYMDIVQIFLFLLQLFGERK